MDAMQDQIAQVMGIKEEEFYAKDKENRYGSMQASNRQNWKRTSPQHTICRTKEA